MPGRCLTVWKEPFGNVGVDHGLDKETDLTERKAPTTDQIRHRIDSGAARDKVDHPDPAAAPLGTDDEAAGVPAGAARKNMSKRSALSEERSGFDLSQKSWGIISLVLAIIILVGLFIML